MSPDRNTYRNIVQAQQTETGRLNVHSQHMDHSKLGTTDFQAQCAVLNEERDKLLAKYSTLREEKDLLQSSQDFIWKKYIKIQQDCDELQKSLYNLEQVLEEGWSYFNGSVYFISSEKKSWDSSRMDCRQRGADLVIIDSREEEEYLKRLDEDIWIGLTDADMEGDWRWIDNRPLVTGHWKNGEPNNGFGQEDENCAAFHAFTINGMNDWFDTQCCFHFSWVCERRVLYLTSRPNVE